MTVVCIKDSEGKYLSPEVYVDLLNGDYVTWERRTLTHKESGRISVQETILTFSNVEIKRSRIYDAINASSKKSRESVQEGHEEL